MATMDHHARPQRALPLIIGAAGFVAFAASLTFDLKSAAAGGVILALALFVAAREARTSIITWPNALAAFVLLLWLLPSKGYRLPVRLPFNLELYRIAIILFVGLLLLGI